MAGQPQENSWMQQGQGQGYSQGAPYQNYQQQPAQYEQQQSQPQYDQQTAQYQQPPAYSEQPGAYEQAAQQPPQAYPGQPQQDQQQNWEQWNLPQEQAGPAKQARPARQQKPRASRPASGEKGFVASLFDFSFSSFVTPKIIKALYAVVTVWTILWAILFLFIGNNLGHLPGLLFALIIVDPVLILVSLGLFRMALEFFMITFRMQEDLKAIRERPDQTAGSDAV